MKDGSRLSVFALAAFVSELFSLFLIFSAVFWNFVVPAILGPVLQCAGFLLVVLGWQLILCLDGKRIVGFCVTSCTLALLGVILAAKFAKVSLIGLKGYTAAGLSMEFVVIIGSALIGSIIPKTNRYLRVTAGVLLVIMGLVLPRIIALHFVKDLL